MQTKGNIHIQTSKFFVWILLFLSNFSTSETDKKFSIGRTTSRVSVFESPDVWEHFKYQNQMYLTGRKTFTGLWNWEVRQNKSNIHSQTLKFLSEYYFMLSNFSTSEACKIFLMVKYICFSYLKSSLTSGLANAPTLDVIRCVEKILKHFSRFFNNQPKFQKKPNSPFNVEDCSVFLKFTFSKVEPFSSKWQ